MSCVINRILFLLAFAMIFQCTENIAGKDSGGTETTNALVVISEGMSVRGHAPGGTSVIICNESFNPLHGGFIDSTVTDSDESFSFESLRAKGQYNIFAVNKQNHSGAFLQSLKVDSMGRDSMNASLDSLVDIKGTVLYINRSGSDTITSKNTSLYMIGTGIYTKSDSAGEFSIVDIPAGSYTIKLDVPTTANSAEKNVSLESSQSAVNVTIIYKEGGE